MSGYKATLYSPFVDVTYESDSRMWLYAFATLWFIGLYVAVPMGYALVLPQFIGFEPTLLLGIAILALAPDTPRE